MFDIAAPISLNRTYVESPLHSVQGHAPVAILLSRPAAITKLSKIFLACAA